MFELHPQLQADTFFIKKLQISGLHLINDARYPWVVLVPEIENLRDLHNLTEDDYRTVMNEIRQVSNGMDSLFSPTKMNVAALGNMVPQLHIHIIARYDQDEAWPGPIWGSGEAVPYGRDKKEQQIKQLKSL